MDKVVATALEAVADVPDGATLAVGASTLGIGIGIGQGLALVLER
ncbi:hypothetical protein [Streptomyces sp. NBC_01314]|nr:hypothetical protein OG622_09810 [Streptomyces sp. NBC_01314]